MEKQNIYLLLAMILIQTIQRLIETSISSWTKLLKRLIMKVIIRFNLKLINSLKLGVKTIGSSLIKDFDY